MSDVLVDGKANVVGVVLGLFFGEHLQYFIRAKKSIRFIFDPN